ncbi:hypothetical protein GCM10009716_03580 [Streptomyces sodiiphilus]|uniref:Metal-dependent phosphohydrolase n=1 Tax=Streptomyces sodiiphilus TaxID=226217 RepID=A0ABP5A2T8_9ACTN
MPEPEPSTAPAHDPAALRPPSPAGPPPDPGALLRRFTGLLERAHDGSRADAEAVGRELLDRWAEPHRHYHTTEHLSAVLARLDELAAVPLDPVAVELAAWFHDAVHDPSGSRNEENSAHLAERLLAEAGVPEPCRAETARLVRLTAGHDPAPGDTSGETLCDADLAVLAGPPSAYAAYAAAVRREYGFVPQDAFREGRAAVLRRLLERPALYRTPHGREHWEATARYNVAGELDLLTGT